MITPVSLTTKVDPLVYPPFEGGTPHCHRGNGWWRFESIATLRVANLAMMRDHRPSSDRCCPATGYRVTCSTFRFLGLNGNYAISAIYLIEIGKPSLGSLLFWCLNSSEKAFSTVALEPRSCPRRLKCRKANGGPTNAKHAVGVRFGRRLYEAETAYDLRAERAEKHALSPAAVGWNKYSAKNHIGTCCLGGT